MLLWLSGLLLAAQSLVIGVLALASAIRKRRAPPASFPHERRLIAEVLAQQRNGIVGGENPIFKRGPRPDSLWGRRRVLIASGQVCLARLRGAGQAACREKQFRRPDPPQFVQKLGPGVATRELGCAKFPSGKIQQRQTHAGSLNMYAGEPVALLRAETGIDHCPGRQDAGDLAADDLLREFGILHLLA